ncbi:MAG: type II secretion system protein GspG [Planctomycetes bacterium]|nr:type II secretion system protein GspG [Planctomycetota bacterium]
MRSTAKLQARGFSAVEILLSFLLILALSAVVVPTGRRTIERSGVSRAEEGCRAIAEGLIEFVADTGSLPGGDRAPRCWTWLRGPGADCAFEVFPEGRVAELDWILVEDGTRIGERWGGPYVEGLQSDPWGRRYVVLLEGRGDDRGARRRVWVLSAGPDGVIETRPEDSRTVGDDLGLALDL